MCVEKQEKFLFKKLPAENGDNSENSTGDNSDNNNGNTNPPVTIDTSVAETTIDSAKISNASWEVWTYSLSKYNGKTVTIEFSADVAVENTSGSSVNLLWQINKDNEYPIVAQKSFANGTTDWVTVTVKKEVTLGDNNVLYLAKPSTDKLKIYMKNVRVLTSEDYETIIGSEVVSGAMDFYHYDLSAYNNHLVRITFSAKMKVTNAGTDDANLMWQVNADGYPIVASHKFESGTSDWITVSGTKEVTLGTASILYLSTHGVTKEDLTINLYDVDVKIRDLDSNSRNWLDVDSLKEAYVDSGIFDHFGIAVERGEIFDIKMRDEWNEASHTTKQDIANGLKHHVNSITMGNEFKPQWFLWHYGDPPVHTKTFTASDGKTINVPNNIPVTTDPAHGFGGVDSCLEFCKETGIQMRGHVLTWHSQTFDWFFKEDYDSSKPLVDKDTMTARHEWYIKTVLDHVAEWEEANGYAGHGTGNHIIYTWDVVNEAVADDAKETDFYRGTTTGTAPGKDTQSLWWQVYGSNDFIINAFRFANKYAPSDVTLCYNDYNEYMGEKHNGDLKLLQAVLDHKNDSTLPTRLDAMAMQSHVENWTGISRYENAVKDFLNLGIDVQVTELDFKWNDSVKNENFTSLEDLYSSYFKLFQKYAKSKNPTEPGITSVTIWGIEDAKTWLNPKDGSDTYYPLLFNRDASDNIVAKDAFFAVIEAAGHPAD